MSASRHKRPSQGVKEEQESPPAKRRHVAEEEQEDEDEQERKTFDDEEELDEEHSDREDNDEDDNGTPRRGRRVSGKPIEAGVIKRVEMHNFMCHRKFSVDLCPNVNFIHGQNGSGKSAILAAIQICLGAGARRTHRARNLAELIGRESGFQTARIAVTLRNEGDDGFRPNTYGKEVTIERTISTRGGGYKLLDASGESRSTSKKDLDALLDHLNIQVENPVAVLDQEDAKKFLLGKPEDKYHFFCKATELERMDRTYSNAKDSVTELKVNRERVERNLQTSVTEVQKLKRDVDSFAALDALQDKMGAQLRLQAWAAYSDVAQDVAEANEQFQVALSMVEKRKNEFEKCDNMGSNEGERALKEARIQGLSVEANQSAELKREVEQQLKLSEAPLKKLGRDSLQIKREILAAQKRLDSAQRGLQTAREEIQQEHAASDQVLRMDNLQKFKDQLVKFEQEEKVLREQEEKHYVTYQDLEPTVEDAKQRTRGKEKQVYAVTRKISHLQSSQGSPASIFGGNKATKLASEVQKYERQGRWTGPVIGPIGLYIKIAPGKEKYAKLAEHAIGGELDRFIVTCAEDRKLFLDLRSQLGIWGECNAYSVAVESRYDICPPPVQGIETAASCFTIEHDLVFNTLVDQCHIEKLFLGNSKAETERLLLDNRNGQVSMRCRQARGVYFLPHGDVWKVRHGALTMRSNERPMKQLIGVDTTAALEDAKQEVAQLKHECNEYKMHEEHRSKMLEETRQLWNKARQGQRKAKNLVGKLQNKIADLQMEIENSADVEEVDTSELEADVVSAEQDIVLLNEKVSSIEKEKEAMYPAIEDLKQKVEEVDARNQRVISEMDAAELDLTLFMAKAGERQVQKDKARSRYDKAQARIPEFESSLKNKHADADMALRQARLLQHRHNHAEHLRSLSAESEENGMAPGMTSGDPGDEELESVDIQEPPKSMDYYAAKVERLKERIGNERERRKIAAISPSEAIERYTRAKNDVKAKTAILDAIKVNLDKLGVDIKERERRWRKFRKHLADTADKTFDEMMQRQGSSGELDFDHTNRALNLCFQKNNKDESTQTNGLEVPFRVMDEFDVCLDGHTRKIALATVVDIATNELEDRQFILITPQDLSSITPSDKVRIQNLPPPLRSNVTIGRLAQQTID